MEYWYLARQLQNFQNNVRGADEHDYYGWQMATMSDFLADDRAINDIVAYINTLNPEQARTAMANGRGN